MLDKNIVEKSIISILGLELMALKDQIEIVAQVMELVNTRLMLRIAETLDESMVNSYKNLLENGKEGQMPKFIDEHIPNFYTILEEEIYKIKEDLGDMVGKMDI